MHVSYISLQILYCYAQWDPMNNKLSSIFSGTSMITFFVSLSYVFQKDAYNWSLPWNTMERLFNILFSLYVLTLICVDVKSICRSTRWGLVLPKIDWLPKLLFLKLLMVIIPLRNWQFHRTLLLTSFHKMREEGIQITWLNWHML